MLVGKDTVLIAWWMNLPWIWVGYFDQGRRPLSTISVPCMKIQRGHGPPCPRCQRPWFRPSILESEKEANLSLYLIAKPEANGSFKFACGMFSNFQRLISNFQDGIISCLVTSLLTSIYVFIFLLVCTMNQTQRLIWF